MKRIFLIGLGILAVLLLVGWLAARWYLNSPELVVRVRTELEGAYGGDVKLYALDVGMTSSSLRGIELYERNQTPWLSVADLRTDLTLVGLAKGRTRLGHVTLRGAKILLRFDKQGKLITEFPDKLMEANGKEAGLTKESVESMPSIDLADSEITLRKEGAPDMVLEKTQATIRRSGDQLVLKASTEGKGWGPWTVDGSVDAETQRVEVTLKSGGVVHVKESMARQVPFVPAAVWDEVQIIEGESPGLVKLGYDLKKNDFHYRVEMEPVRTRGRLPTAEFVGSNLKGKLVIDDNLVQLRGVTGEAYGGRLSADADLDFRGDPMKLAFTGVEVSGLDVSQFPESWKFPKQIRGKLQGKASLEVDISEGHITPPAVAEIITAEARPAAVGLVRAASTAPALRWQLRTKYRGGGTGKMVDATVFGQPAQNLEVSLIPGPRGFSFGGDRQVGEVAPKPAPVGGGMSAAEPYRRLADWAAASMLAVQEKGPEAKAPARPAAKKEAGPQLLNISLKMKDFDLAKFVKDIDLKLPFPVSGTMSFEVKAGIPFNDTKDLKKYRLHGDAQLRDFVMSDLRIESAETVIDFKEGILTMPTLKGRLPPDSTTKDASPATFTGKASLQVEPLGDLLFDVAFDRLPLSQVAKFVGAKQPITGDVSATISGRAAAKDLKDPSAWQATGKVGSERVVAFGWNLMNTSAFLTLAKGQLTIGDFHATLEGAPITGGATVGIAAPYPIQAKVGLAKADLGALQRLVPEFRPPVAVAGVLQTEVHIDGTAQPMKLQASGVTDATDLKVERFTLKDTHFAWSYGGAQVALKDFRAHLYEGEVFGSATVPLSPAVAGAVDLQVKDVNVGALTHDVPKVPVKVEGKVSGGVKGTLLAVEEGKERQALVHLDLKAPRLRLQNIPTEEVHVAVEYKSGTINYKLEGKGLGGTFELEGDVPTTTGEQGAAEKTPPKGHLKIDGVQIGRLLSAFATDGSAATYGGRLNVRVDYTQSLKDLWPHGSGRFTVVDLSYKDTLLAPNLGGELTLQGPKIILKDVTTSFGQGTIRARGAADLRNSELGWFVVDLDNVEAEHLLAPWLGDTIKGNLRARLRGKLGTEAAGTADVAMDRGSLSGLEVSQLRLPITFRIGLRDTRGEIELRDISAQAGHGQITGRVTFGWDYTAHTEGHIRFSRADVQTLLRQFSSSSSLGGGQMSGRFDFVGHDVRSVNDISGALVAAFEQSQALNIPVLQQIAPFLGVGPSTTFQKGSLVAHLDRGVLRIKRLSLDGTNLKVFIDGTVTLAGRLNLDVYAKTANLNFNIPGMQLLSLRVPLAGPVPITVAQEAINFLSNRLIHLTVTGTIHSPMIRIHPLATLTQEAIRYFLGRELGPFNLNPDAAIFGQ